MTRQQAFVHVGLQKTGTSFLQSHLWDSPDELRAVGVLMVPDGRAPAFHLTRAVRQRLREGVDPAKASGSVEELRATVARATEPRLLLSQESLAAATAEQAARLLGCFAGRELHVVLTARDIARQLPSMWQQRVKARADLSFSDFLDEVREHRGSGKGFWAQQDLPAVLERWGSALSPDRVHVVTVPQRPAGPTLLAERFGSVVGVDFARLSTADPRPNVSLDPAQTELVRRVNQLRPLEAKSDHARTVKQFFAAQVLAPQRGAPARTPRELAGWCREVAAQQVTYIGHHGFSVVGDLEELMPVDDSFGPPVTQVDDSQVAAVAVPAIAELLSRHNDSRRELSRLREENERLRAGAAADGPGRSRSVRRLLHRRR